MLFISCASPDSRALLVDAVTGTVHRTYTSGASSPSPNAASFCRATGAIVCPQDKPCVLLLSPATQQPVHRCFVTESVACTAVSSCGNFVAGGASASGCLFLWCARTGELLRVTKAHLRAVTCISFAADSSMLATSSVDSACKVWTVGHLTSPSVTQCMPQSTFTGHTLSVTSCEFFRSLPWVLTGSQDRTCRIFEARSGTQLFTVNISQHVTVVRVLPLEDGFLAGGARGCVAKVQLYDRTATAAALLPVSRTSDAEHPLFKPCAVERSGTEGGHGGDICMIDFAASDVNTALVASTDGVVLKWDVAGMQVTGKILSLPKLQFVNARLLPFVAPDAAVKPADCPQLAKYPVDLRGDVGYILPVIQLSTQMDTAGASKDDVPRQEVKRQKKHKHKRRREEGEAVPQQEEAAIVVVAAVDDDAEKREKLAELSASLDEMRSLVARLEAVATKR